MPLFFCGFGILSRFPFVTFSVSYSTKPLAFFQEVLTGQWAAKRTGKCKNNMKGALVGSLRVAEVSQTNQGMKKWLVSVSE